MRLFIVFFLSVLTAIPLCAEDPATNAPVPVASPDATPPEAPAPPAATPTPEAAPSAPEATPVPALPPAAGVEEDIIPLPPEGNPVGAPPASGEPVPDSAFTDPNAVIPDEATANLPPAPSGPSADEINRKLKIRYQEVRTQVDKDPAVRSLREQAEAAKSFEDERAAYREYYRLLFQKMAKEDKTLKDHCKIMEAAYLSRLAQTRLEPTIPLKPPPTPEPLAN